ncbi:hypothetical protein AKJ09_11227 [Labilithrix luteola]|uniref:Uncharacterized protein n=2 Tax=Labilithrix luteola TaxID=1391654 RepID=A0A0K1QFM1_9BACT|nr:hypothetical protein AKJ09_11227 [Labilithrix luteola]
MSSVRATLVRACAQDPSRREELRTVDAKIQATQTDLEIAEVGASEARAAYKKAVADETHEKIAEHLAKADVPTLIASLMDCYVYRLVDLDRQIADAERGMQALCYLQGEELAKAKALAATLGEAIHVRKVDPADIRVTANVAIAYMRAAEKRDHQQCELLVTPVTTEFLWVNGFKQPNPLATSAQFEFANRALGSRERK